MFFELENFEKDLVALCKKLNLVEIKVLNFIRSILELGPPPKKLRICKEIEEGIKELMRKHRNVVLHFLPYVEKKFKKEK